MQEVLSSTKSGDVHLFIVWLPILRTDNRDAAIERTNEFSDPRVGYYWDESKVTGEAWQKVLGLDSVAWDVYFLYQPTGKEWTQTPELPLFWMHQLRGVEDAPFLDKDEFRLKMLQLLRAMKK